MQEHKLYWMWLSGIKGFGSINFVNAIRNFGSAEELYITACNDPKQLKEVLTPSLSGNIIMAAGNESINIYKKVLDDGKYQITTLKDDEYPDELKNIHNPPPVLYTMGIWPMPDSMNIAVVGSRSTTSYGVMMARQISRVLAENGISIISGMARGIDTCAHTGALEAENGYTAAVFGCGLDICYPAENRGLRDRIIERGSIITEFPPSMAPLSCNFPARNRIISGLSYGTLVVEAGTKSGAVITAGLAAEQGREVYAVPGDATRQGSRGTNKLIKDGAMMVTSVDDLLDAINMHRAAIKPGKMKRQLQLDIYETMIYESLQDEDKNVDDIVNITGMDISKINSVLTLLEMKGIIKSLPGRIYSRNI